MLRAYRNARAFHKYATIFKMIMSSLICVMSMDIITKNLPLFQIISNWVSPSLMQLLSSSHFIISLKVKIQWMLSTLLYSQADCQQLMLPASGKNSHIPSPSFVFARNIQIHTFFILTESYMGNRK